MDSRSSFQPLVARGAGAIAGVGDVIFSVPNLVAGDAYDLFLVVEAPDGSLSPLVPESFTHGARLVQPSFEQAPSVHVLTPTTATVSFTPSSANRYYWVVLTESVVIQSGTPERAQVRNGQDSTGNAAQSKGAAGGIPILGTGVVSFSLLTLSPATSYRVFVVLADASNRSFSTVEGASFATEALPLPSFFVRPVASSVTSTSAVVSFVASDAARYCWVLLPDAVVRTSGVPTEEQVRRGQDGTGAPAPHKSPRGGVSFTGGAVSFSLSNLTPATSYHLYLVLANASADAFSRVATTSFTTQTPLPSFSSPPLASSVTSTSAAVSFTARDAARYCWVLLPTDVLRASGVPTEEQVRRGQDGTGSSASFRSASGGVRLTGSDAVSFSLLGLSSETAYHLYVVLANAANNAFSTVATTSFTTQVPPTPSFSSNPLVSSVTTTSAAVSFTARDAARYCWVLLSASSVQASGAPTAGQVRRGQDGSGLLAAVRSPSGGVALAAGAASFVLPGLIPATSYHLFLLLASAANDAFSLVAIVSFVTAPDPTPPPQPPVPTFLSSPTVVQHAAVRTTAVATFVPSVAGRYYWVVQSDEITSRPDSFHVLHGQNGNGAAVASGHTNAPPGTDAPAGTTTFEIPSLELNKPYTLSLLLVSTEGVQGAASAVAFTLPGVNFGNVGGVLSFSPNPVSDFLRVTFPTSDTTFEVYSLAGDLLFRGDYPSGAHTLPFSDYELGVYVLRISSDAGSFSCRLVKK